MQQTIAELQIKNGDNRRRGLPNTQPPRRAGAQPHYSHTKPLFGFASRESVTPTGKINATYITALRWIIIIIMHTDFLSPGRDRRPPQFPQSMVPIEALFANEPGAQRESAAPEYNMWIGLILVRVALHFAILPLLMKSPRVRQIISQTCSCY